VKTISRGNALIGQQEPEPRPATLHEAARILKLPQWRIVELAKAGTIPCLRYGPRTFFDLDAVRAVLARLAASSTYTGGTFQPELAGQQ
jgi:hypothetical protein